MRRFIVVERIRRCVSRCATRPVIPDSAPVALAPHILRLRRGQRASPSSRKAFGSSRIRSGATICCTSFGNPVIRRLLPGRRRISSSSANSRSRPCRLPRPARALPPLPWQSRIGRLPCLSRRRGSPRRFGLRGGDSRRSTAGAAPCFPRRPHPNPVRPHQSAHSRRWLRPAARGDAGKCGSAPVATVVLFIAAARSQGLAARFVSGYQAEADTPDGRRHLHAWPEVFLPGIGWRGYDPTQGVPVTDGHVATRAAPASSRRSDRRRLLSGGRAFASTLSYEVRIETGASNSFAGAAPVRRKSSVAQPSMSRRRHSENPCAR